MHSERRSTPQTHSCRIGLTTDAASLYLDGAVAPGTLRAWRRERRGPAYVVVAGRVYYPREALDAWLQSCPRFEPLAPPDPIDDARSDQSVQTSALTLR